MIHYISPYRSDKDIGRANNECIERLGRAGDWICLTDADAMPLLPDFGTQIERIVSAQVGPGGFHLIGCATNRLGSITQLHNGEFSNDWDIRNHRDIAIEAREQYGDHVEPTRGNVAGLFMLFPYDIWKRIGGFREHDITADIHFNKRVRAMGGKVGVARGLYFFHAYRMGQETMNAAKFDIAHLCG